jgi:hypothetical protein
MTAITLKTALVRMRLPNSCSSTEFLILFVPFTTLKTTGVPTSSSAKIDRFEQPTFAYA